jgi:hypothetical protein
MEDDAAPEFRIGSVIFSNLRGPQGGPVVLKGVTEGSTVLQRAAEASGFAAEDIRFYAPDGAEYDVVALAVLSAKGYSLSVEVSRGPQTAAPDAKDYNQDTTGRGCPGCGWAHASLRSRRRAAGLTAPCASQAKARVSQAGQNNDKLLKKFQHKHKRGVLPRDPAAARPARRYMR